MTAYNTATDAALTAIVDLYRAGRMRGDGKGGWDLDAPTLEVAETIAAGFDGEASRRGGARWGYILDVPVYVQLVPPSLVEVAVAALTPDAADLPGGEY